jgi:hypothetical protein
MLRTWTIDKTFRFMLHTWNPLFGTLNSIIGTLNGIIGTLNGIIGALIRTVLGNGGLSHHYLYEAAIAAAANSRCNQRREILRGRARMRLCASACVRHAQRSRPCSKQIGGGSGGGRDR